MHPTIQLPAAALADLERADQIWQRIHSPQPRPSAIQQSPERLGSVDWDVAICGGTLGILLGAALARRGWRVLLLERGILRGREQEWNLSQHELGVFLDLDLLSEPELEQVMVTHYNPARIQFRGGPAFWVRDVLNIGVDPRQLLDVLKERFLAAGGILRQQTAFEAAILHPDGVEICTQQGSERARLLIDAMGHLSPIVAQARHPARPDGVCLVVGGCAEGLPALSSGDLLYSGTPIQDRCQYFWEAFPARDGRTTYLFTYGDPSPQRPDLKHLFSEYLRLLPDYQGADPAQIRFRRCLFGCFPAYRHSPLQSPWDRILFVGDSSGAQSPLSFGGFGAMVRHLPRLSQGIGSILKQDDLRQPTLALLQPYQPNLSVTWLFQQAMSVTDPVTDPDQINHLLNRVFAAMFRLGEPVYRPFLQDVIQFGGLSRTLIQVMVSDPVLVAQLARQAGAGSLLDWSRHYGALGLYTLLHALQPGSGRPESLLWQLRQQAWKYGCGADFQPDQALSTHSGIS